MVVMVVVLFQLWALGVCYPGGGRNRGGREGVAEEELKYGCCGRWLNL